MSISPSNAPERHAAPIADSELRGISGFLMLALVLGFLVFCAWFGLLAIREPSVGPILCA